MTDDQANHHQSTVPTCCLFITPRHNRPSHAEQMVYSYLTVSELIKNLERMAVCRGCPNLLNQ